MVKSFGSGRRCGSIEKGHKRGEAIVEVVNHQSGVSVAQGFYNGHKESERPVVESLLKEGELASQNLTMDALHLIPATLKPIQKAGGWYVVGLKSNQLELYTDWVAQANRSRPVESVTEWTKGHGRIEKRHYSCFCMQDSYVDVRWQDTGLQTFLQVERERLTLQGESLSVDTHYYVSNAPAASSSPELFGAIRRY